MKTRPEKIIESVERTYSALRRDHPDRDQHWLLANTWLERYGATREAKRKGPEVTRFIAYKETHQFSILGPPESIRALALFLVYKELGAAAEPYGPEFGRIMEPAWRAWAEHRFFETYKEKNPGTLSESRTEPPGLFTLSSFVDGLERFDRDPEFRERVEGLVEELETGQLGPVVGPSRGPARADGPLTRLMPSECRPARWARGAKVQWRRSYMLQQDRRVALVAVLGAVFWLLMTAAGISCLISGDPEMLAGGLTLVAVGIMELGVVWYALALAVPRWARMLPGRLRPDRERIRQLEKLRARVAMPHEAIAMGVMASPTTTSKVQKHCLQQLSAWYPGASKKDLLAMVLISRVTTPPGTPMSDAEFERAMESINSFDDLCRYIVGLDEHSAGWFQWSWGPAGEPFSYAMGADQYPPGGLDPLGLAKRIDEILAQEAVHCDL